MKRLAISVIFVLAVVVFGTQGSAQTIDLISQTYHIEGVLGGVPILPNSFDVTSSVPPLIGPTLPGGSNTVSSDGRVSGASLFVAVSSSKTGADGIDGMASAELVFRAVGASALDLSYSLTAFGFAGSSITLSDLTTGVTLVNVSKMVGPPPTVDGSAEVPVVASDIYRLYATSQSSDDPAYMSATLTAVPESSALLLVGFGLIGLVGFRRKFKGVNG